MSKTTIFYNGNIHTMDSSRPTVTAVACRDGKFINVGNYNDFGCMAADAEVIDLEGRFAFPGFIDCYSAPGIAAFIEASAREDDFDAADGAQWIRDMLEVFCDKGAATVCLHGSPELNVQDSGQRFLTGVEHESDFEKDLYGGYYDAILDSPLTSGLLFAPVYDDSQSVHEAIDRLTWQAAADIGMETQLGTVEPGKLADMTIFETNPFENDLKTFSRMHDDMLVVGGEIIYDASAQAMTELYDLLTSQAF